VAQTLNNLAISAGIRGDATSALAYSRKASAVLIAHAAIDVAGVQQSENPGGVIERRADIFQRHVASLGLAFRAGVEPQSALGHEGFEIAQWANHSSVATAMQQLGVRIAAGNDAFGDLVRNLQDRAAEQRAADQALVAALSRPEAQQDRNTIDSLNKKMGELDSKIAAVAAQLERQFPD
jgi:hypothetical protein